MAKKPMDAEELANRILELEESTRGAAFREVVETLSEDGWVQQPDDEDTWVSGFNSAIEVVKNNFNF